MIGVWRATSFGRVHLIAVMTHPLEALRFARSYNAQAKTIRDGSLGLFIESVATRSPVTERPRDKPGSSVH